ncbi:hypothetical protein LZ31DRAFT_343766 [Colletotrichum somersetense]|nr:hypothetical protein LZ31DRAFT_343766 [Colletotrichum somersetense]
MSGTRRQASSFVVQLELANMRPYTRSWIFQARANFSSCILYAHFSVPTSKALLHVFKAIRHRARHVTDNIYYWKTYSRISFDFKEGRNRTPYLESLVHNENANRTAIISCKASNSCLVKQDQISLGEQMLPCRFGTEPERHFGQSSGTVLQYLR